MLSVFYYKDIDRRMTIDERMKNTLRHFNDMPYLTIIFYIHKNTDSKYGVMIKESEEKLFETLKN